MWHQRFLTAPQASHLKISASNRKNSRGCHLSAQSLLAALQPVHRPACCQCPSQRRSREQPPPTVADDKGAGHGHKVESLTELQGVGLTLRLHGQVPTAGHLSEASTQDAIRTSRTSSSSRSGSREAAAPVFEAAEQQLRPPPPPATAALPPITPCSPHAQSAPQPPAPHCSLCSIHPPPPPCTPHSTHQQLPCHKDKDAAADRGLRIKRGDVVLAGLEWQRCKLAHDLHKPQPNCGWGMVALQLKLYVPWLPSPPLNRHSH